MVWQRALPSFPGNALPLSHVHGAALESWRVFPVLLDVWFPDLGNILAPKTFLCCSCQEEHMPTVCSGFLCACRYRDLPWEVVVSEPCMGVLRIHRHTRKGRISHKRFFLPSLSIFLMDRNSHVASHIPLCDWIQLGSKPVFELKIVSHLLYFSSSALFYSLAGSARRYKGKFGNSNWIISVVSSNGMIYSELSVGRKSDMISQGHSFC